MCYLILFFFTSAHVDAWLLSVLASLSWHSTTCLSVEPLATPMIMPTFATCVFVWIQIRDSIRKRLYQSCRWFQSSYISKDILPCLQRMASARFYHLWALYCVILYSILCGSWHGLKRGCVTLLQVFLLD